MGNRWAAERVSSKGCGITAYPGVNGRLAKLRRFDPGISSPESTFANGWIAPATMSSSGHEGLLA
jgi:hypothetical protein